MPPDLVRTGRPRREEQLREAAHPRSEGRGAQAAAECARQDSGPPYRLIAEEAWRCKTTLETVKRYATYRLTSVRSMKRGLLVAERRFNRWNAEMLIASPTYRCMRRGGTVLLRISSYGESSNALGSASWCRGAAAAPAPHRGRSRAGCGVRLGERGRPGSRSDRGRGPWPYHRPAEIMTGAAELIPRTCHCVLKAPHDPEKFYERGPGERFASRNPSLKCSYKLNTLNPFLFRRFVFYSK